MYQAQIDAKREEIRQRHLAADREEGLRMILEMADAEAQEIRAVDWHEIKALISLFYKESDELFLARSIDWPVCEPILHKLGLEMLGPRCVFTTHWDQTPAVEVSTEWILKSFGRLAQVDHNDLFFIALDRMRLLRAESVGCHVDHYEIALHDRHRQQGPMHPQDRGRRLSNI